MKPNKIIEEMARLDGYKWYSNGYEHKFMERDSEIAKLPLLDGSDLPNCDDAFEGEHQ